MRGSCRLTVAALGFVTLAPLAIATAAAQRTSPVIVDHRATGLSAIPVEWIEEAKASLHIGYGHTSHGSQITDGMSGLAAWKGDLYAWNRGGVGGALDLDDGGSGGLPNDVGYYPDWVNATHSYLGTPDPSTGRGSSRPAVNVVMWSWCGQAAGLTAQQMLDRYLTPMTRLEAEYPGVSFVYMTGHLDGTGASGNLNLRNQQIRDYVAANNKVLFDFADIESFDPDGLVNYMELDADDGCNYDANGDGTREKNWCTAWQGSHTEGVDWYQCGSAHSEPLNANRKAYAAWWLWARLVGWDDERSLSMADASASEGDEASAPTRFASLPAAAAGTTTVSFEASLSKASAESVTVNFATVAGTATAGVDFVSASGSVTFAPGETTKTITIQVIGDTIDEPNEVFSVVLSGPANATIEDGEGVGTIIDDDTPTVSAAIADTSVTEGNSGQRAASFLVTLSGAATQETRIDYVTANGSASAGSDYTTTAGTLVIPQGATSGTISIAVLGDTKIEVNETFTVTLSNAFGATLSDASAVGTITNDDFPALSIADASLTEGNSGSSNMSFTVTLSAAAASAVTVNYATAEGTATAGSDYTSASGTLTFTTGQTSRTISVPILGDTTVETNEAFTVTLSGASGATIADGSATGTITDDDSLAGTVTPVTWTSAVGVTVSANSLRKTTAAGWNAGAVSAQQLASGDGYVELTASETNTYRLFGLSHGNAGTNYTEIDFGIDLYANGTAVVYENGTALGSLGGYRTGDVFRVEVAAGVVRYRKNGVALYTSLVAPSYPLLVDTALYGPGSTLKSVVVSGDWAAATPPTPPASVTTPVSWTSAVGVTVSANGLTKTAAAGWNAGAVSARQLASGDGYVELTASETNTYRLVGLSNGNAGTNYAEIDFGIDLYANATAVVYENGSALGNLGSYRAGDVFRVEVTAGVVRYLKNGATLYTSLVAPGYPLLVDTALYSPGSTLKSVVVSGDWAVATPPTPPASVTTPVSWTSAVGVTVSTNSLRKTTAAGWNAGAVSAQQLASGDGYVELTASETNTYRLFGLSSGNAGTNYTEIDFGIDLYANGTAVVYENGSALGNLGSYRAGDVFRIEVTAGVVRYRKNGATLYTSLVAPSYPLLVDTALYNTGATLKSVVVSGAWSSSQ